jgi:hypothetical protein
MRALIDSDRIPYCFGNMTNEEGFPLEWEILQKLIDENINSQIRDCKADSWQLYITSDDKSNFRFDVATIKPYKGNRKSEKYFWYEQIRRYLVHEWKAEIVFGMEADDALGIEQYTKEWAQLEPGNTIISSVDKDLDCIPGWHWNELREQKYFISEIDADRNFFSQLLTGDDVDNIPGLYGVGKSSSLLSNLKRISTFSHLYLAVKEQYEKRFGSYWKLFMYENAQLLYILRTYDPNEVINKFNEEERRLLA